MVHHHSHVVLSFASSMADLRPVKDDKSGIEGLYWIVDYPWPLWDRDVSPCAPHTLQRSLPHLGMIMKFSTVQLPLKA